MDFALIINIILSSSIMAGFLIILIFIIRRLFNKSLDPKLIYIIWFALIVRLAVPYFINSPINISNLFASILNKIEVNYWMLFYIWIFGIVVLSLYTVATNIYFWFKVKDGKLFTDQKTLKILKECKEKLGVNTNISIINTSGVGIPAIFGVVRPWLLIPDNVLNNLPPENLRYVFMHELAHMKRKDIIVNWIVLILQIIHWFNPLVWFAFNKMRADREIACDSEVLAHLDIGEEKNYGHTILDLAEIISGRIYFGGIAGILEDKSQIKNRINKISQFKKKKNNISFVTVFIIVILLGSVLVNANDFKFGIEKNSEATPTSSSQAINTVTPNDKPVVTPNGIPDGIIFPLPGLPSDGDINNSKMTFSMSSSYPNNNQAGVRIDYLISVEFNKNIFEGEAFSEIKLYEANGKTVEINTYISNNILVVNHVYNLEKNKSYILHIPANAIIDSSGNSIKNVITIKFSTGFETPIPNYSPTAPVEHTATPATSPTWTPVPTNTVTAAPTKTPTTEPTRTPTTEPTRTPTIAPTNTPTDEPTATPTDKPTATPTDKPTPTPTSTDTPTPTPTTTPTPTEMPTITPTEMPTTTPTSIPTSMGEINAVTTYTSTLYSTDAPYSGTTYLQGRGYTTETALSGKVSIQFDVTPGTSNCDEVIGFADKDVLVENFNQLAILIRMNTSGTFDCRNGSPNTNTQQAITAVPYTAGTAYHFDVITNTAAKTYSVWVTPAGGTKTQIAADYYYRTTAQSVTDDIGQVFFTQGVAGHEYTVANCMIRPVINSTTTYDNEMFTTIAPWSYLNYLRGKGLVIESPKTGNAVTINLDVTPSKTGLDTLFGFAGSTALVNSNNDLSMLVAFSSGFIKVRKGGQFTYITPITYVAGTTYHFEFIANMTAKTYSVWCTPAGGTKTQIAADYGFRLGGAGITATDVGQVFLTQERVGDDYTVANFTIN